jgi:hypothetical protein
MTIWEFISKLSNSVKTILISMIALIPIGSLYFYKYMPNIDTVSWYLILCMLIAVMGLFYILEIPFTWMVINFLDKEFSYFTSNQEKWMIIGIACIVETALLAGIGYLWIETAETF